VRANWTMIFLNITNHKQTQQHNPQDMNPQQHCCENLKSCTVLCECRNYTMMNCHAATHQVPLK